MNLILLFDDDFVSADRVRLDGRRREHILTVHRAGPGDRLSVGRLNGALGEAELTRIDPDSVELRVSLDQPAPPPLPLTLILALPRPKMLKRIYQTVATMGVKRLVLINSFRVEKSYWQAPALEADTIGEHLMLGLEQGKDTILPEVLLRKRFKPFVEDELPELSARSRRLVAHPVAASPCPAGLTGPTTLAVGPEGGFIVYEVEKLAECGFTPITLGPRILRVETAIPALLAKLFY